MRTDPTDNGGLFIGRRPGTAPVHHRALPEPGSAARRRLDALMAWSILALMALVSLCFWGPIPAAWLWLASQLSVHTDSVSLPLVVCFVGMLLTLIGGLSLMKRLDAFWVLVRRAAGHDQRHGVIGPVFALTAAVCGTAFTIWLLFIAGLGPSFAPGG